MLSIVNESETKVFQQELLTIKIYPTLQQMGNEAAKEVADRICKLLEEKAEINMIFAAAPSQDQLDRAAERGVELRLTPIGKEAFVFFVNSK